MLIHFPSTFAAEFRVMRGAEISAMANRPDAASSDAITDILRATWVKTVDPGPYAFESTNGMPSVLGPDGALLSAPQFDKVLSGDLMYGLLSQAVASVPNGRRYSFQVQCERVHPQRQYEWQIDLLSQLLAPPAPDPETEAELGPAPAKVALRSLAPDAIEHLRATGNRFETSVAGTKITYKLQSPSDDKPSADLRRRVRRFTPAEQLAVQVLEIEGLKSQSVLARHDWMLKLDGPDLYALFAEVEGKDCGIDTGISTKCQECGWEQETDLPFGSLFRMRRT